MPSGLLSTLTATPLLADATSEPYYAYLLLAVMACAGGRVCLRPAHSLGDPRAKANQATSRKHPFECGLESKGDPWVQFNVQYYLYALAFVIFDIEAVFLYPWAVAFTGLSFGAFLAMGVFILLLAESLIYLWIKGVLTWK